MTKERERYLLDCARAIRPDLFTGDVQEDEAPDFVLGAVGSALGVEITQYARPVLAGQAITEEQAGLKDKLLTLAKARFVAKSATRLRVGVVFTPGAILRKRRVLATADRISSLLLTRLEGQSDWTRVRCEPGADEDKDDDPLDEIASVYATVIPPIGNMHWYPADAGWVWNVGEEEIARIVARKEPKVRQDRKRCDRLSLLIVFEARPQLSSSIHAPTEPVTFRALTGLMRSTAWSRQTVVPSSFLRTHPWPNRRCTGRYDGCSIKRPRN